MLLSFVVQMQSHAQWCSAFYKAACGMIFQLQFLVLITGLLYCNALLNLLRIGLRTFPLVLSRLVLELGAQVVLLS